MRFQDIIDFIFPKYCIACHTSGDYLCKSCKKQLLPHPEICPVCHRYSTDYQTCINCRSDKENFLEWIIIPFAYKDWLKKLILRLKYYHKKDVTDFLVERLALAIQTNQILSSLITSHSSLITSVPSHRYRKYFIKGYNQSELLAKKLSQKTWIPYQSLVQKKKHSKTQAGLDRKQRLTNLQSAFTMKENNLTGTETILIVDDVTTTWSTINEIAKTIKHTYPKTKIWGVVLGRHIW